MTDVTIKHLDQLDRYEGEIGGGEFLYAGKGLGVTAWAMNALRLPARWDRYPEHDHADDGQEEVYVVLDGSADLHADGESWSLTRGTIARVGPTQKRRLVPGDAGVTLLVIGGTPGQPYKPAAG